MNSEDEFQKLIDTVEQQERHAEEEVRHVEELARQLHKASSAPKTMSTDGPSFGPQPWWGR